MVTNFKMSESVVSLRKLLMKIFAGAVGNPFKNAISVIYFKFVCTKSLQLINLLLWEYFYKIRICLISNYSINMKFQFHIKQLLVMAKNKIMLKTVGTLCWILIYQLGSLVGNISIYSVSVINYKLVGMKSLGFTKTFIWEVFRMTVANYYVNLCFRCTQKSTYHGSKLHHDRDSWYTLLMMERAVG